ncbi:MAG TPA: carboxypeptidase-like regulatory domain-containing protein [Planctomycetota bacterium]|nr:carboxypeptidase-like regulatory domain-containing protein [Planctomycetota bacterium]
MVTSPPGVASRVPAIVLALLVVCAGGAWYVFRASYAEASPAPAPAAAAELTTEPRTGLPDAAATSVVDRSEAPAATPTVAVPRADAGVAPTAPAPEAAAVVHGRVVDVRGAGIADARVAVLRQDQLPAGIALGLPREVRDAAGEPVHTDSGGAFAVPLAKRGSFELIASHDGHPSAKHAGVADGPRVEGVVIVLRDGGSIAGMIEGAPADVGELEVIARALEEGVAAAAGAAANAMFDFGGLFEGLDLPIGARKTVAAADGTFRLIGLEPGARFWVFALRKMQDGKTTRCTERMDVREGAHGVRLRWRESLAIVVRVLDADTGSPIEDLDVSVGPVRKMVVVGMSVPVPMRQPVPQHHFADGLVQIDGISVDDGKDPLSIEVRAPGHRAWLRDDLDATRPGRLDLGVVQLVAAPVVRVTVVCGDEPVAGAKVRLVRVEDAPADREDGPRSSIMFSTTATTPANPGADPTTPVSIPVTDTRVTTDANGICELTADFAGRARINVSASGHAAFWGQPFELPSRGVVEHRAVLWRGGKAAVRVVDGHGAPLAGATVRRSGAEPKDTATAKTDAQGAVSFRHVAPGTHSFALDEASASSGGIRVDISGVDDSDVGAISVQIGDGQVVDVLLTAPLRGSLRGVVTLDGQPLDRAEVAVVDVPKDGAAADLSAELGAAFESMLGGLVGEDQGQRTKTGVDGEYELASVRAGARRVLVRHKRLAMPACSDVTIVEGINQHDIALRSTTLRGRVLDQRGEPIEGALVAVSVDIGDAETATARADEAAGVLGELFGGGIQHEVRTDKDGAFELGGVRPGVPLRVRATSRLHVAHSVRVDALPAGSARDGVELRLGLAGRVRVRASIEGALSVRAEWSGGTPVPKGAGAPRTAVLKSGRATLEGLPPGRWRLGLEGSPAVEARGLERTVEVGPLQTVSVEF